MSAVDSIIALRIIHLLVTPFSEWEAGKSGIIDAEGKLLITDNNKLTTSQRESWTMLHRLVWRLKLIIAKVPGGNSKIATIAAAYLLVKESKDYSDKNLHETLSLYINKVTKNEISLVEDGIANCVGDGSALSLNSKPEILNKKKMIKRFKDYSLEKINGSK